MKTNPILQGKITDHKEIKEIMDIMKTNHNYPNDLNGEHKQPCSCGYCRSSETNHTPTPWKTEIIGGYSLQSGLLITSPLRIIVKWKKISDPVNRTNARHIVKCVNSHDILIKSLLTIKDTLEELYKNAGKRPENDLVTNIINPALKNIESEG